MKNHLISAAAALVLAAVAAMPAAAATVGTLDGVSFDSTFENVGTFGGSIALTTGAYGWTNLTSTARTFRDAVLITNAALISASDAVGAYAVQLDTKVAIQAGNSYSLSVDLGFMTPVDARTAPYTIELGVLSSTGTFTRLATSQGTATMGPHFGDGASLTVNTGYLSTALDSGDLTVRLTREAGGSNGRWMGFDNVVLTAQPVPEPATYALFAVGLAGLAVRRLRQRG